MTANTGQQQTGLYTLSAMTLHQPEDIPFSDLDQQQRLRDRATHGTVEAPGDGLDQQRNMNDQLLVRATDTTGEAPENGLDQQQRKDTVPKGTTDISGEAPDGGWGWVITCAALLSCFIVDGISFSFGVFHISLLDHFGESRSLTAWISSVMNGTYLCIGPIVSMSVNMFGCRVTAIAGSTIASIASFLCTFSPNDQVMIVVYGFLGGFGLGLLLLASIVTVGHYFTTKKSISCWHSIMWNGNRDICCGPVI